MSDFNFVKYAFPYFPQLMWFFFFVCRGKKEGKKTLKEKTLTLSKQDKSA